MAVVAASRPGEFSAAAAAAAASACQASKSSPDEVPAPADDLGFCKRHCHDPDFDMQLVMQLIEQLGIRARFSLTFAISQKLGATPREVQGAVRVALRALRLMHKCGFQREDIRLIVAHAVCYMQRLIVDNEKEGQAPMDIGEMTHVFSALLYVAHSWVLDETCPLCIWHAHLFTKYCSLRTLSAAVLRLMERLDYRLRVPQAELEERLVALGQDPSGVQCGSTSWSS